MQYVLEIHALIVKIIFMFECETLFLTYGTSMIHNIHIIFSKYDNASIIVSNLIMILLLSALFIIY